MLASLKVRLRPEHAISAYWAWYWPWPYVRQIYDLATSITADVWLANDWVMLPVAARLAKERGGIYVYDTHELAIDEYSERLRWRLIRRPFVKAIEDHVYPRCQACFMRIPRNRSANTRTLWAAENSTRDQEHPHVLGCYLSTDR